MIVPALLLSRGGCNAAVLKGGAPACVGLKSAIAISIYELV
jgi:hypothetical protein